MGTGARGGDVDIDAAPINTVVQQAYGPPALGVARGAPVSGEIASPTTTGPAGGVGGIGQASAFAASFILHPGLLGGGGGAASGSATLSFFGGQGGGSFIVLARGAIENAGTITANGIAPGLSFGGGGGGGGVVILASLTSVKNDAAGAFINARGGAGGGGSTQAAPGGGGGGGIVHLIAPTITTAAGNADVTGGTGGTAASITANPNQGGSGGGACGGDGGAGSQGVVPTATPANGGDGQPGFYIQSLRDPTPLF